MRHRWSLSIAVLALMLTAGCLFANPGTTSPDATETTTEMTPEVTHSPTPTQTQGPTPPSVEEALKQSDPNKSIWLENRWDKDVTLDVEIIRNTSSEVVYDASHEIQPGSEQAVYHTGTVDPEGVEGFTVSASTANMTAQAYFETNECYGNARIVLSDDAELQAYSVIC